MIATGLPIVSLLTTLPLAGGLAILLFASHSRAVARSIAALSALASLAGICWLGMTFPGTAPGMQLQEWHIWEPSIGLAYHLGVDGLSLVMLAISSLVVLMSVSASWNNEKHGPLYLALLLFLETGLFGTFTALNFLHWFLYWELSLIPAFFLVRLWGGVDRARAATQFFLYTMVGSISLLLAFLALFLATRSFEFLDLTRMAANGELAGSIEQTLRWHPWGVHSAGMLLFWAAFLGFAVKTPVFPFHGWLASTYGEAAPETTMVLTGALSKMGIYGFLRILAPIFPTQMLAARPILLWLAVASVVVPAFAAWAQRDLRRMLAYSSMNHLGYCVLAVVAVAATNPRLATEQAAALTGVMLQLFSHGVTAAALFWFLALLARRSGGLLGLPDFGGLRRTMPVFTGMMGIATFASLGLPGLIGFPGEFLIFKGVFPLAAWAATWALLGLLVTALFLLTFIERVFSGPLHERWATMPDLTTGERWALAPFILLLFVLGLFPQLISGYLPGTVLQFIAQVRY